MNKIRVFFIIIGFLMASGKIWGQDSTARSFLYPNDELHRIVDLSGYWMVNLGKKENWSLISIPSQAKLPVRYTLKRNFSLDSTFRSLQHRLIAEGIDYEASFTINNVYVGSHRGGNNSFELILEPNILRWNDNNEIFLDINTEHTATSTIPLRYWPQGPENPKGVHRAIYLLSRPKARIEKWQTETQLPGEGQTGYIRFIVEIQSDMAFPSGSPAIYNWQVMISDSEKVRLLPIMQTKPVQLISHSTVRDTIIIPTNEIELWKPDSPKLYDIQISLWQNNQMMDRVRSKTGFRNVAFKGRSFTLNGEKLFLKSIDWVEDISGEDIGLDSLIKRHRSDLIQIKAAGANLVRVRYLPPLHNIPAMCDEIGLLLWVEIPVQYIPTDLLVDQKYKKDILTYLRETVLRDRNHPSVIAWGLGTNFDLHHEQTSSFLHELSESARQLDDRPVYIEVKRSDGTRLIPGIDFTVINLNTLSSWQTANYITQDLHLSGEKPVIVSFGIPFLSSASIWTEPHRAEDAQAFQIEETLHRLKKIEGIAGISITALSDWRSSRPWLTFGFEFSSYLQRYGLLDRDRRPRVAYSVVKAFFTENEPIHISPVKTLEEYPVVYPITGILFLLFFLINYRRDRALRVNFSRIFIHPHGFYMDLRDNRRVNLWHTALLALALSLFTSITFSSLLTNYRNLPIAAHLLDYLVRNNALKEKIILLIWHTEWNMATIMVLTFFGLVFAALFIALTAFIIRRSFSFRQGFMLFSWVGASWLLALPISIILIRLMHEGHLTIAATVLLLSFLLWFIVRFFRGFRVGLALTTLQALLLLAIIIAFWIGIILIYMHHTLALFKYLPYFYSLVTT